MLLDRLFILYLNQINKLLALNLLPLEKWYPMFFFFEDTHLDPNSSTVLYEDGLGK
jgi:hypothetical protein